MSPPAGEKRPWAPSGSPFWYRVIRASVATYLRLYHRFRSSGRSHVPEEGGVLIVGNHASFIDIPIVAASVDRHVSFVARDTLADSRFIAWVIRVCGGITIRRGESDRGALRAICERLDAGYAVAIFPEGTRSRDGRVGEFRGGALFAARRSRVPIVPVGIRGSYEAFSRHHAFPRPRAIECRIGLPVEAEAPELLRERVEALTRPPESTPRSPGASVSS